MPRELEVFGIAFPGLLLLLLLAAGIGWVLDGLLARVGFFQFVWHPPLFRVSLTLLIFCLGGLLLFSR